MATCAECSEPLVRKRTGPPPKYCSGRCRAKAKERRARQDGRYEQRIEAAKARAQRLREANARPCPYCGTAMSNPRRVQCGQTECKRKYQAARVRDWYREHREKTGERYNARFESQRPKPRYVKSCEHCGRKWTAWNKEARYCSLECWSRACRAARAQLVPRTLPPWWARRPLPDIPKPLRRRWYCGQCIRCSKWFIHDQPTTSTCSPECSRRIQRRISKDRRRAREREAFVARVYRRLIFERDRWTCQLCGKRVVRTAEVPHPKAPVLDHIVPLADHGTHEPANVQCAHFLCNSIKGDRGGGEQLMLIG